MEDRAERRDSRPVGNSAGMLPVSVAVGEGRTAVHLRLMEQGRDILVVISGGDAHVGAIAACDGRMVPQSTTTNGGMVQMPGHREGPLAAAAAETLAAAAGRTCAAVVGIHQDGATPTEIRDIVGHVHQGLQQLAALFSEGTP